MPKPRVTKSGAYASTKVGEVFVVAATRTVDDAEWIEHCEILRELATVAPKPRALLLHATGSGPTSKQRKTLATEYRDAVGGVRCALLSDSIVARGVTTAIGWLLGTNVKAFEPDELEVALKWLAEQVPLDAPRLREALVEVRRAAADGTRSKVANFR